MEAFLSFLMEFLVQVAIEIAGDALFSETGTHGAAHHRTGNLSEKSEDTLFPLTVSWHSGGDGNRKWN